MKGKYDREIRMLLYLTISLCLLYRNPMLTRPYYTLLLSVIFTFLSPLVFSQQGNIWYFGYNAGLTFNSNPVSVLNDGQLSTDEGCAVMSDFNGRLLFYTDGSKVWNRQHQIMSNGTGLYGHSSAANSAIIVPRPGSSMIFYIFTADATELKNVKGYNYSEVDMSLNGGLGDVTSNKNIPLYAPCSERLTGVRAANGIDIWVITKTLDTNEWLVYKVDCNGVNPTPVRSAAGVVLHTVGCLKGSPDGKRIAATTAAGPYWEILDFDNSSGTISNAKVQGLYWTYGVEFSPDSKLVYVTKEIDGKIYQYDLSTFDSAAIANSAIEVATTNSGFYGGLQLGPDKKIYCTNCYSFNLSVINAPDNKGLSCNFVGRQVQLSQMARRTLPVFFSDLITGNNANFTFSNSVTCGNVAFSAVSTIQGPLTYNWDFGDGITATGQNVTHQYPPGTTNLYTVKLTIVSSAICGGTAIATKQINPNPLTPVAKFGFTDSCGKLLVSFYDSSTVDAGTTISSWNWDFGDGIVSTDQNPLHTYSNYGTYNIKLLVTSASGCNNTSTLQQTLLLKPKPVADFINSNTCVKKQIDFSDKSSIPNGSISKWYWSFGNGAISSLQNSQQTFNAVGNFQLQFAVTSAAGCTSDTLKRIITVNGIPKAEFTAANGCVNQVAGFRDNASINFGSISRWYWDFGNGNFSTFQNPSTYYNAPGSYNVKQVVESTGGCISDTSTQTIQIDAKPIAAMTVTDGCQNQSLNFVDQSSTALGSITKWYWDFGNGTNSSKQQPSPAYPQGGNYTVKLVVTSKNNCASDTALQQVEIESIPKVDFTFTNTCVGKEIYFNNVSSMDYGTITNFKWDFANGTSSSETSPVYIYNRYGNYKVSLSATTTKGCSATKIKTVNIERVNISAGNDTTAALGQPIQLTAAGAALYLWWPSSYLNDPLIYNPICTPDQNITYYFTGTTAEGCIGYDTITIKVYKGPTVYVPNAFAPNGKNKIFRPVLVGIKELHNFSIFNRWGQMIFTTKEPGKGWDGTIGGNVQPANTYVWILQATDFTGKIIVQKGTVTLIR
jgi:gliding motility-associated-like protein